MTIVHLRSKRSEVSAEHAGHAGQITKVRPSSSLLTSDPFLFRGKQLTCWVLWRLWRRR